MENNTWSEAPSDGYSLPVYGLTEGHFYTLHIPALSCIFLSFASAVLTMVLSFRQKSYKTFFSWSKSERFVVYLAICDAAFNLAHSMDHLHILITKNHVYPKELCEFYGFMLAEFITAQNLMVNIIAVNAFVLILLNKQIDFGIKDYRLLLWTFGTPFICATVAGIAGQLGPNGSFCYFDGVKGTVANFLFTTVPLTIILVLNSILYSMTLRNIYLKEKELKKTLGKQALTTRMRHAAARAMSVFVLVFLIQWWAMAVYGLWSFIEPEAVPAPIYHLVTTFSNVGGILNFGVYLYIRRRLLPFQTPRVQSSIRGEEFSGPVHL
ncbi:uncharacterized protein LOC134272691 [Saccostrea cucullata]|uniref:uncharacterized protein LOC134272691 n=1 Tax=Saccostrea cuccullata TaxID=36930 RepID=UPI002ED301A4